MTNLITKNELELFRQFIDAALHNGWTPCNGTSQGTYVIFDPPVIRISCSRTTGNFDCDSYLDYLSPLVNPSLARAAWGRKLVSKKFGYLPEWKHHQFQLLEFLQEEDIDSYFQYLTVTLNEYGLNSQS